MNAGHQSRAHGFTLIELMIVVSIMGIFMVIAVPMQITSQRLGESEVGLQKAHLVLRSTAEAMRALPGPELAPDKVIAFDLKAWGQDDLVDGKAEARMEEVPDRPGLFKVRAEVVWTDAWKGKRTIHTLVYRAR
jgi:prepilin-type N-terminal cleavage/methylation domain-containing protein